MKFREWDGTKFNQNDVAGSMQNTGQKDVLGNEIFEKDVVSAIKIHSPSSRSENIFLVLRYQNEFGFGDKSWFRSISSFAADGYEIKLLGNLFQNKMDFDFLKRMP